MTHQAATVGFRMRSDGPPVRTYVSLVDMRWLLAACCMSAAVGCGKSTKSGTAQGSGSGAQGSALQHDAAATAPWRLVMFLSDAASPGAILSDGANQVALVNADGTVRWKSALAAASELENLRLAGNTIVVGSGKTVRALDAANGHERWRFDAPEPPTSVKTAPHVVVIEMQAHAAVLDVATGHAVYTTTEAVDGIYFGDATVAFTKGPRVVLVDEGGAKRWESSVDSDAHAVFPGKDFVVVRGAPSASDARAAQPVWKLDAKTGRVTAKSTRPDCPESESPTKIGQDADGTDYCAFDVGTKKHSVIARDAFGTRLWELPLPSGFSRWHVIHDPASDVVALDLWPAGTHTLYFVQHDGRHQSSPVLGETDRFVGIAGTCALVLVQSPKPALACIDTATGKQSWSSPLWGRYMAAWPLNGGDSAVLDSNPLSVSRFDASGHRTWQQEVPASSVQPFEHSEREALDRPGDNQYGAVSFSDGEPTKARHLWMATRFMGVLLEEDATHVLDVTAGKLRPVTP